MSEVSDDTSWSTEDAANFDRVVAAKQFSDKEQAVIDAVAAHGPQYAAIAREFFPGYRSDRFKAVAGRAAAGLDEIFNQLTVENEAGKILFNQSAGINRLVEPWIQETYLRAPEGVTDMIGPHSHLMDPMLLTILYYLAELDPAFVVAGKNLFHGESAQIMTGVGSICFDRDRMESGGGYGRAMSLIHPVAFNQGIHRGHYVQPGRGPGGIPHNIESGLLRYYLAESIRTNQPMHYATMSISTVFTPDMHEIIAKLHQNSATAGRDSAFSESWSGYNARFKRLTTQDGLESLPIVVTVYPIQSRDDILGQVPLDRQRPKDKANAIALYIAQHTHQQIRVMSVDAYARSALDPRTNNGADESPMRIFFEENLYAAIDAGARLDSALAYEQGSQHLDRNRVDHAFETARKYFSAVEQMYQGQLQPAHIFEFHMNRTKVQYKEHELKLA